MIRCKHENGCEFANKSISEYTMMTSCDECNNFEPDEDEDYAIESEDGEECGPKKNTLNT